MNILVACEESQRVCEAFRNKGHNAFSCDIIDASGGHPEWHIKQDVLPLLNGNCSFTTCDGVEHNISGKWDLIIGHPPCTYMSKAGARWMYPKAGQLDEERYKKALKAKEFFMAILNADCEKIVVENPTPLKIVGLPKHTQVIQPYEYDVLSIHPYTKRTLLWIKGVEPLKPTTPDNKPTNTWLPSNTSNFSKGKGGGRGLAHNAKDASKTFEGIALAMAEQWG